MDRSDENAELWVVWEAGARLCLGRYISFLSRSLMSDFWGLARCKVSFLGYGSKRIASMPPRNTPFGKIELRTGAPVPHPLPMPPPSFAPPGGGTALTERVLAPARKMGRGANGRTTHRCSRVLSTITHTPHRTGWHARRRFGLCWRRTGSFVLRCRSQAAGDPTAGQGADLRSQP